MRTVKFLAIFSFGLALAGCVTDYGSPPPSNVTSDLLISMEKDTWATDQSYEIKLEGKKNYRTLGAPFNRVSFIVWERKESDTFHVPSNRVLYLKAASVAHTGGNQYMRFVRYCASEVSFVAEVNAQYEVIQHALQPGCPLVVRNVRTGLAPPAFRTLQTGS